MHLTSPTTAIMAAVIYNALIIVALIPLALKGVKYREATSQSLLSRNLLVYGVGGIILPFVAIKVLDMGLTALGPVSYTHLDVYKRQPPMVPTVPADMATA